MNQNYFFKKKHSGLRLAQDYKPFPQWAELLSVLSKCEEWQPPCPDLKKHRQLKGCGFKIKPIPDVNFYRKSFYTRTCLDLICINFRLSNEDTLAELR